MNILDFVKPKDHRNGAYLETITPVMAQRMMEQNKLNRPIRPKNVRKISKELRAGNWDVNGETIKFDPDGNVLDGQNRLTACLLTGISFKTYVVYGLDPKTKTTIDTGVVRSASDVMAFEGVKPHIAKIIGPAIGWLFAYAAIVSKGGLSRDYTNQEALDFFKSNRVIADLADLVSSWPKNRRPLAASTLTFIFFETARLDQDLALDFMEKLCTGARMDDIEPAYHARNFLEDDLRATTRMSERQRVALLIKAWNRTRRGDRIPHRSRHSIKWRAGEAFPHFK